MNIPRKGAGADTGNAGHFATATKARPTIGLEPAGYDHESDLAAAGAGIGAVEYRGDHIRHTDPEGRVLELHEDVLTLTPRPGTSGFGAYRASYDRFDGDQELDEAVAGLRKEVEAVETLSAAGLSRGDENTAWALKSARPTDAGTEFTMVHQVNDGWESRTKTATMRADGSFARPEEHELWVKYTSAQGVLPAEAAQAFTGSSRSAA